MITNRPEVDDGQDSDDPLREAILATVRQAPPAHEWSHVVGQTADSDGDGSRPGRPLLAAAAVLLFGVAGIAFVASRPDTETVRTDDPLITTSTTTPAVVNESAGETLPKLPSTVTRSWSTTIDGGYPQSAVRIGDMIMFGQRDLPGVRAVDALSGDVLWSFIVDDPDPDTTIFGLDVVDDRVILSWMDSSGRPTVTALDTSGSELWGVDGVYVAGGVIRISQNSGAARYESIAADGSVIRTIDSPGMTQLIDDQLVSEADGATTWYGLPGLDRIAGPITFPSRPDFSVVTADHVVTVEGNRLGFFDQDGRPLSDLDIGHPAVLEPVDGERPGVVVIDPRQDSVGRSAFFELVDDEIVEVWTRPGRFEELVELAGRAFVVHRDPDEDAGFGEQGVIDASTGEVLVSNDSYDSGGARNGFVFVQLDTGPDDVQTVAYDVDGQEMWRLQLDGPDRAEIVDGGVLVAPGGVFGGTVELTFYE